MHTIQIPDDHFKKLSARAEAAGFSDVVSFVVALAEGSWEDPRGVLSEVELRRSAAELDAADAEIAAGAGVDADEALRRIADKHGFTINR